MTELLPNRPEEGHKGTFGTVFIAGGSVSNGKIMLGGAVLTAEAAIRSGAGLTVFVAKKEILIELIKLFPQAIGEIYAGDELDFSSGKPDAIVIGPGLGMQDKNTSLIKQLLNLKLPTVIDADGLNTISKYPVLAELIHEKCIITPHPKEFERLSKSVGVKDADELAITLDCTVVLKGHQTYVTNGKLNWTEEFANPALATGGTGDVLAGLIGGLMAQFDPKELSVFDCAKLAVKIHSNAGKEWASLHGSGGLIIDELLELIPKVMDKMRQRERVDS